MMQTVGSVTSKHSSSRAGALKWGALLLATLLAPLAWAAVPANDNWANAQVITNIDFGTITADSAGATVEPGEPSHAGFPPRNTIWYSWTASSDAPVEFDTYNSGVDTILAVYTGTNVANLSMVVANDDVASQGIQSMGAANYIGPSGVKFNAKRGTTYYICVGGYGGGGQVTLSWAYHSSGVFRFTSDAYECAETESAAGRDPGLSTSWSALGTRITVTRVFGSSGKVILNFNLVDGTAVVGTDYRVPFNTTLIFEDFEMSKSFLIPIVPGGKTEVRNFAIDITGVALDPLEDPTVLSPPRIDGDHSSAVVTIWPMQSDPADPATIPPVAGVANFERRVLRTSESVGTVRVAVYRVGGSPQDSPETHYVIDSTTTPGSNTRDNTFQLEAASDYAHPSPSDPGPPGNNGDFSFPTTDPGGYAPTAWGTLSWGQNDFQPKYIEIPIIDDNLPEFNEDLSIQLFAIGGHTTDLVPGFNSLLTLTILYDDYPAGALDPNHNPDLSLATDPPVNSIPGADGTVYALTVQSDNKTVIAGNFGTFNTVPRYGIARLNDDGSLDHGFNPGDGVPVKDPVNPSFITCLAQSLNGKFVIGGSFPSYNGTQRNNIAQLNANGSLDDTFNPGLGANGTVWSVAVQTNGQVLIGGEFTTVNGYARSHIARLNTDGTLDQAFDPGTNGPNGSVNAIVVAPDGSIYIGGDFNSVNGLSRRSVALLTTNGVVSTNFTPIVGAEGPVFAMGLQFDGKLLIGGFFPRVELRSRNNIARYNADGSLDLSFDPGTGTDDAVYSITLQGDGRMILGGLFNSINQTRRMCVGRLYATGEVDTGFMDTAYNQFAGPHKPYYNPYVNWKDFILTTGLQQDGNLMIGGSFHYVGGGRYTLAVQTNNVSPCDQLSASRAPTGLSRATYRVRYNVARLFGGSTEGPGSLGLVATNYTAVENMNYLYVKLSRQNGTLGQIEATFSVPPRPGSNGVGVAQSGVDYLYNRVNPFFDNSWPITRAYSDGLFGTNNGTLTVIQGGRVNTTLDDIYVTIPHLTGYQGDRTAPFKIDMPSFTDVFYLGGDNIPLGTALARTVSTLAIQEVDVSPGVLSFSDIDFSVNENGTNAIITVIRTNGSTGPVSFKFATTNGTAIAGTDYLGVTNTITLRDGQVSTNISIPVINDFVVQSTGEKTVNLYLANPGNGSTLGTLSNAVLHIIDDDFQFGRINFRNTAFATNETAAAAVFTVTRSGGNLGILEIRYATSNLTALAGVNFVGTNGLLHWDNGDISPRYITVPLLHDGLVTSNKQFYVALFSPSVPGSPGSRLLCTNTIVNEDFYGSLQFATPVYNVSENGGYATINVIRTGGSAESVSATYATSDGTAYAWLNYQPTSGTLRFGPGEVSKSFDVPIFDDLFQDPANFFFNVQLAAFSPASSFAFPTNAQVNIVDAQSFTMPPGQIDTAFNPDAGFNDDVYALALQPDAKIVAAGSFTVANGLPVNRITRLMPDGTLDSGFLTTLGGANGVVRALVNQTDTRLLVGGAFTMMNNVVRNSVARLNADGTIDNGFNPGSGGDGPVYSLAETFVNGPRKVMVGGAFSTFNGAIQSGLVRLNDDGTVDSAFNTGLGVNGTVFAVAVYPTNTLYAGKVLVGGDFTSINGVARNRIARLNTDGSVDTSFNPGAGLDNTVRALTIQPDGKVLVGGSFTKVNNASFNRIVRLNGDGSIDSSFQPGVGANDLVYTIALQPDNRILLGGQFTLASAVSRNRITRLMPNGAVDPTINFGTGADSFIASVLVQPDSRILIAGGFTMVQGLYRPHLARLYGGSMTGSGSFKFDAPIYIADESSTNVLVTVLRTGGTSGQRPDGSGTVTLDFSTSDGTAIAGINYSNLSTTLNFPVGETLQTIRIPLIDDQQITPDLTVNMALANPTPPALLGPQPTALLTIRNIECAISFSSPTFSRAEDAIDGAASIQIVRSGSIRSSATVEFITSNKGTAIPGVNYTPMTSLVVFQPNQSSQLVKLPIFHVPTAQGDTTVIMDLTNASGALLLAPYQATLTILDVEEAPGQFIFSQAAYVVGEGDTNAFVTVLRTNGHFGPVSVAYTTLPGSATPNLKYISTNDILSFGDGELSKTFKVPILQETQVEGPQTLSLLLTNPTGGAVITGRNPVDLTILDDDIGVSFASGVYIITETNNLVTLEVLRLNTTNGTTFVNYATTNGTATAGVNYLATSGTLKFNPGESRKSISISVQYDSRVTGDLTFAVNLSDPTTGVQLAAPSTANVVVVDVDSGVSLLDTNIPPVFVPTYTVGENATNVTITVIRTNANSGPVQVNYATVDDTAIESVDYVGVSGTLLFTNNQASNIFTVPIIDNQQVDGERRFGIVLSAATAPAQLLAPSNAVVKIVDDDSGFRFSSSAYEVLENGVAATILVERLGATNGTVTVRYETKDGSARAGVDYLPATDILTFTNGETRKSFTVTVLDNTVIDGDRTVLLDLASPSGNSILIYPSAATLTIHDNDGSLVIPAGVSLISENMLQDRVLQPGETVNMLFAFRNDAGSNTMNLVATLLATNGVASPSGPQSYGVLVTNGPSVSRPFSLVANGTNGQRITATFVLTDNGHYVGTNSGVAVFNFVVGTNSMGFTNGSLITIRDNNTADPYPAKINVSGIEGVINKLTVTVTNLNHRSPADIDMLLVSPAGQAVLLMANAGGYDAMQKVTLTFDDAAANGLPGSQITSGTYQPTAYLPVALFPVPAPPTPAPGLPYTNRLAAFNGSNPNGDWSLFIIDDMEIDGGAISNGWSLQFTLANTVPAAADVGVYMTGAPDPVVLGSNVTYTITVTNFGPAAASGVTVLEPLPRGLTFVSATPSIGTVSSNAPASTNSSALVTWNVGSLAKDARASLTLVAQPIASGVFSNAIVVTSTSADLNLDDDRAQWLTTVITPTADLSLSVVGGPNPVFLGTDVNYSIMVSNIGPGTATSVSVSDTLPPGVTLVSALPAGYTVNGNVVTWGNLGAVGSGGSTSASLVVRPSVPTTLTNTATCTALVADPAKVNNKATIKTVVNAVVASYGRSGNNLVISWPADATSYSVEWATNLVPPVIWAPVTTPPPVTSGGQKTLTVPIGSGNSYFRLRAPVN